MESQVAGAPAYSTQIFAIALFQASRAGLQREDAQDCAMDFVVRLLGKQEASKNTVPEPLVGRTAAWLQRCAHNHACNYARSLSRRRQREQSWTDRFGANGDLAEETRMATGPGPRTLVLRRELWKQIATALERFTPDQREIFIRFHIRRENTRELAVRFKRSPHAVEECLSNVRKRLATLLRSYGWTEEETQLLFRATLIVTAVRN